jgi:hypothetical protein
MRGENLHPAWHSGVIRLAAPTPIRLAALIPLSYSAS